MDLTEFLLARITDDEERPWQLEDYRARVLAECEAKRAIIALHPEMLEWCQGCAYESYPCRTILALAAVYADHPDCPNEWRIGEA